MKREGETSSPGSSPKSKKAKADVEEEAAVEKRKEEEEENQDDVDDDELEEGEVEEDDADPNERASKAWILDLKNPPKGRVVRNPLEFACSQGKPIPGLWLEFGVFSGKTINLMARHHPTGVVYGFDTFEGLPEAWRDKFDKGHFDCKGKMPPVSPNVTLVKGLFQDTLEPFLAKQEKDAKVSVAHLDADLYSATIYVLQTLAPRIVEGTLLVFDELINYQGFEEHEWKALLEAVEQFGWEFEWIAQSDVLQDPVVAEIAEHQQVALRITKVAAAK